MKPLLEVKKKYFFGVIVLLSAIYGFGQSPSSSVVKISPHTIRIDNGTRYSGEMGYVKVPEFYADEQAQYIEIPFYRIKTTHKNPLPPLFVLPGGPGDNPSVLQQLEDILPILIPYSFRSDVIVVEQRGNGLSKPNLVCPGAFEMPLNRPLDISKFSKTYVAYIKKCSSYWQEQNRNLRGYNVLEMVQDIEMVRKALSYEKIMILGGSFGSHHGLAYLKAHPNRVDRAIFDSPEGLKHTIKLPSEVDRILEQLSQLVAKDPVLSKKIPSFLSLVKEVLHELDRNPVTETVIHPMTQEKVSIVLGKYDLQLITALELGRMGYRELPFRYLQMKEKNFSWAANYAIHIRVNQRKNLMAVLTDCASGATLGRWRQVIREGNEAILGDALNNINFMACRELPLRDIMGEPQFNCVSDVPILLISGSQDARTPPKNAQEIMLNHRNIRLLNVEYGTHDLFREVYDQLRPIMTGYFAAEHPLQYKVPKEIYADLDFRME
ncbi:alpha/beta hydrolase [Ulvibacterium sp.]|uniref:alpha/beta hydrolase n=1 Tax=Ulvibacterium sp. TaxID=2665914 RepID=UPI0026073DEF|nr:alpha/beta hydrolase [Ulvibacterium sp.]